MASRPAQLSMTQPTGDDVHKKRAIATGRRVLKIEADALTGFAGQLDENFAEAVTAMLAVQGRIVVSGMGKSGHIGRKIAATLASTGTPAQFVHPAEASHGDLGMITRDDLALVLSNSGETPELADIIAHCKRHGVLMIGVASRPESTLMQAADISLALPKAPEACSVGLAPTTSTTMTIALGDALAVALMERRDFTPDNFRMFHPGGKLGAQLIKVEDLMHTGDELPLVPDNALMSETLLVMSQKGFGIAGVVDSHGDLAGVVTDGDLRRNMEGLLDRRAGDVATTNPKTIAPEALAQEALALMNEPPPSVTTLFVVRPNGGGEGRGAPVGIVHIHDFLRHSVS